jgi:hypothetical protein
MCVLNFSKTSDWNIFHSKRNWCYQSVHLYPYKITRYSWQILIQLEFSRQTLEKYSNKKSHENPSSGSCVVPCGRTDVKKLIVAFRNFANAHKNIRQWCWLVLKEKRCNEDSWKSELAEESKLWKRRYT